MSVYSGIGIIVLIGVVVNNGIVLIDYMNQLMQEKNILSETRLAELNEWQQISEIQFQLDWLENFKKQYIN